jgi:hypothetical protein
MGPFAGSADLTGAASCSPAARSGSSGVLSRMAVVASATVRSWPSRAELITATRGRRRGWLRHERSPPVLDVPPQHEVSSTLTVFE